jgi:hypothetical protein
VQFNEEKVGNVPNSMRQRSRKGRFWAILAMINVVAMIYPVNLYFQADGGDAQFFATIVLLGAGFLLAITDTVSALVAYWQ